MSVSVKNSGGGENVKPEVQAQTPIITDILESLVGKAEGPANATPDTILKGYSAYVGQELVEGNLGNVIVDGEPNTSDLNLQSGFQFVPTPSAHITSFIPESAYNDSINGTAIMYRGEIHVLGYYRKSGSSVYRPYHGKWDGTKWVADITPPTCFNRSTAVVYDDKIYVIGGDIYPSANSSRWSYTSSVYYFNGTNWTQGVGLPNTTSCDAFAVVIDNEIHLIGGCSDDSSYNSTMHMKWKNGDTSWTDLNSISPVPSNILGYPGAIAALDDGIHFYYMSKHVRLNGNTWTTMDDVTTTPLCTTEHNGRKYAVTGLVSNNSLTPDNQLSEWDSNANSFRKMCITYIPSGFIASQNGVIHHINTRSTFDDTKTHYVTENIYRTV